MHHTNRRKHWQIARAAHVIARCDLLAQYTS